MLHVAAWSSYTSRDFKSRFDDTNFCRGEDHTDSFIFSGRDSIQKRLEVYSLAVAEFGHTFAQPVLLVHGSTASSTTTAKKQASRRQATQATISFLLMLSSLSGLCVKGARLCSPG